MMPPAPLSNLEARLAELNRERAQILDQLREEKRRHLLPSQPLDLDQRSYPESTEAKVALFLKLFATRRDVYPRLWENLQLGRKGYSPVCETVWEGGRRLKPMEILERYGRSKFSPLNEKAVESHLRGTQTIGTYAIRPDDTCTFLATDFDGEGWQTEANSFRDEAATLGIACLVEISRSGNGAHAWILFAEPVAAALARRLGSLILARVTAKLPSTRLESYDRFFPNQDTLPKGGFGNLIALPLQKEKRKLGFTEFVDTELKPHPDQWAVLASIHRHSLEEITAVLQEQLGTDSSEPDNGTEAEEIILELTQVETTAIPVITDWKLHLAENVVIPLQGLPASFVAKLKRLATLPNPVFFEKQRQRFPIFNIPKYLFAGEIHPDRIVLPRGCLGGIIDLFADSGARVEIEDRRLSAGHLAIHFCGELRTDQKHAVKEMSHHEYGVLVAPPGAGKTVMACALIAKRKLPTVILVNRQTLLDQWVEQIQLFTDCDKKSVGQLCAGKKKVKGKVDVAMIQTLAKIEDTKQFFRQYGMVVIDECHHIPAVTLEAVLKTCGCRYIIGLTATPKRKDGLERLLYFQCGDIRHVMAEANSHELRKTVHLRTTGFVLPSATVGASPLHLVWQQMIESPARNQLIADDILATAREGRVPLVLSDRKEQLANLMDAVSKADAANEIEIISVDGSLSRKLRGERLALFLSSIAEKKPACLFATASLLGEGFDLPQLDTLILAMPISFKGRIIQYAGRLHRPFAGKSNIRIYDYLDDNLALTASMYRKRAHGYRELGYEIIHEGEAGQSLL